MLPGHQTPTTSHPLPLFFCYNRQLNDILYSNQELVIFFKEAETDWRTAFLFRQPAWQKCLLLEEKESYTFSFEQGSGNNKITYSCKATAVKIQAGTGIEPVLMCTVENTGQVPVLQAGYEEFIHLAAHDLDAPARKLTTLFERLATKIDPEQEAAAYIPRIEANLSDMRQMIDGLAKLAGTYGKPQQSTNIATRDLITGAINTLRKKKDAKQINLEMGELPVLQGDPEVYRVLFHHLLENAVVFSKKESPVSITITSEEATTEEKIRHHLQNGIKFYKISVRDQGIGFHQDDAEKIFRPFTKLHGKSEYPGSGMGLAICKRIVENYSGAIYAEGRENEGAGFTLFLPQSLN